MILYRYTSDGPTLRLREYGDGALVREEDLAVFCSELADTDARGTARKLNRQLRAEGQLSEEGDFPEDEADEAAERGGPLP